MSCLNVPTLNDIDSMKSATSWNTNINESGTMWRPIRLLKTLNTNKKISTLNFGVYMVSSMLRLQLLAPKHIVIKRLARFSSSGYKQLKYIVCIISGCVFGGGREIKIPKCYFNMK